MYFEKVQGESNNEMGQFSKTYIRELFFTRRPSHVSLTIVYFFFHPPPPVHLSSPPLTYIYLRSRNISDGFELFLIFFRSYLQI